MTAFHIGVPQKNLPLVQYCIMHIPILVFSFCRFRVLFVYLIPCVSLVILNILLFVAMNDADKKRQKLLNSKHRQSLTNTTSNGIAGKRESRETKKIRDTNTTTLMLIVVITVSCNVLCYYVGLQN